MNLKNIWGGNVGFKGVILVALVSLVVGLGISGSLGHDRVSSSSQISSSTSPNAVNRSRQYRPWGLSHAEISCSGS